ncbi:hypothetical protein EJB05_34040 [Eragrostis curvula]|uniref:rRNA N-glycosylase n=1 Tax=Eragrostis curvula TaxID=38414 RepID=A0A5J9U3G2_9POAL|nr:hypothetical protein EJB05_34040 [Eragrostis curvula]
MAKSSAMAGAGLLVAVLLLQFSLHPAAARHLLDDEYSQSQLASTANSSVAAGVPPPPTAAESHVVWPPANFLTVDFDAVRELYSTFQNRLVTALTGDPPRRLVSDIPLLVEQTGDEPPPEWIFVRLTGRDHRTDKVTIAVRNDNVYLVGFKQDARPGTWFAFEERTHLIPASQILPVGHSYGDLVKGHKNLIDYDMGKASFLDAIHQVATYQPNGRQEARHRADRGAPRQAVRDDRRGGKVQARPAGLGGSLARWHAHQPAPGQAGGALGGHLLGAPQLAPDRSLARHQGSQTGQGRYQRPRGRRQGAQSSPLAQALLLPQSCSSAFSSCCCRQGELMIANAYVTVSCLLRRSMHVPMNILK